MMLVIRIILIKTKTNFLLGLNCFALSSSLIVLGPVERGLDGITRILIDHLILVLLVLSMRNYFLRSLLISTIRILTCG